MKTKRKALPLNKLFFIVLYYIFARWLPESNNILFGKISMKIRYSICSRIFHKCGKAVNIERKAFFGLGTKIIIGDESGLGINCNIPNGTYIGKYVMMGPNCFILPPNHKYERKDIPMNLQGHTEKKIVIIEDDVWIGRNVTITQGRIIKRGSIIGACCLLTKDFPPYSIVGGNPSLLIKYR